MSSPSIFRRRLIRSVTLRCMSNKLAQLAIPDSVYNWLLDFFRDHAHCTKFAGIISAVANICASVIQGSAIGPAFYIVTAAYLHPVHKANQIFKFADDTYLVVPATRTDTCHEEINHLRTWAAENNLKLNRDKTKEIVFTSSRKRMPPPPRPGIERVSSLRIPGVIVNDRMAAADHVTMLLSSCSSLLYAMSPARARHSGDIVARYISRHCRFPDPVCGASMVRNMFVAP